MKHIISFILLALTGNNLISQKDSLTHRNVSVQLTSDTSILFQNKKIDLSNTNQEPKLEIGAYVSTYYSLYTEDAVTNYVKHATMAARNNQFGLNMAMVSLAYKSSKLRSNITFHYGDIAESTWPQKYNLIQEANAGINLVKNLWLDAGVFRSHIGLESTQPRENITSSMSLANVYEPYYFSGAKLTYLIGNKLSLQLNAFNSFSSIIETNKNKIIGASVIYAPSNNLTFTYNFITGDDTPDSVTLKHQRYYHNLYLTYQKNKFTLGAELNYGLQQYSKQINATTLNTAAMNSGLLVLKHQTYAQIGFYGRGEWFSDVNEILSSGLGLSKYTWGVTTGVEYKPLKNIALSVEGRYLKSEKENVIYNNALVDSRFEGVFCLDVWF